MNRLPRQISPPARLFLISLFEIYMTVLLTRIYLSLVHQLKQIEEYMSHRRLPVSLRDKITKYYEHRFQGKLFDEERLLAEVSRPLRKVSIIIKARTFPLQNLPVSLLSVLRIEMIVN